jgi:hypothetical protein
MKAKRSALRLATHIEFGLLFFADGGEDRATRVNVINWQPTAEPPYCMIIALWLFEANNPMALSGHLSSGDSLRNPSLLI